MRMLTLNCGSSSIKCALVDTATDVTLVLLSIENIGNETRFVTDGTRRELGPLSLAAAIPVLLDEIEIRLPASTVPDAMIHRVVHGGEEFSAAVLVDAAVLERLHALDSLAPLHNPPALAMLRTVRERFANVPQIAVFDTAFHHSLPPRAREYALPRVLAAAHGLRRFGFHGINCAYLTGAVALYLHTTPQQLRTIACHLGNGASVTAIEFGHSVDTSMGMTPLEGLVMGSRAGDIDAGVLLRLLRSGEFDVESLDQLLNSQSGLLGLTGTMNFAAIEQRAAAGDDPCRLAIGLYAHRVRKYIGAYAAVMGGADAIAFSGGVGEHSALVRHRVCQRLEHLGAVLDEDRNRDAQVSAATPVIDISADVSRVRILVVLADEQRQMAREAAVLLKAAPRGTHT